LTDQQQYRVLHLLYAYLHFFGQASRVTNSLFMARYWLWEAHQIIDILVISASFCLRSNWNCRDVNIAVFQLEDHLVCPCTGNLEWLWWTHDMTIYSPLQPDLTYMRFGPLKAYRNLDLRFKKRKD
jgi:hypothetical protein